MVRKWDKKKKGREKEKKKEEKIKKKRNWYRNFKDMRNLGIEEEGCKERIEEKKRENESWGRK